MVIISTSTWLGEIKLNKQNQFEMIMDSKHVALFCSTLLAASGAGTTIKLQEMNIEPGSITTSGLSSGGYMAVQLHVAHSSIIEGSAIYAGGPYYCAQNSLAIAEEKCMFYLMGGPSTSQLISYTDTQASKGAIDDPKNMEDDKIYIFSGSKDTTVDPKVVFALEDYYNNYVSGNIVTKYDLAAQHCIPTLNYGETCAVKSSPYIGKCSYEGAGEGLQTLYGTMNKGTYVSSHLYKFDQTEFFTGTQTSLEDFGYIYIPTSCESGATACKLHVSFHGCLQDYDNIQDTWAVHAGYNEWAEANNIIVVYPYATANAQLGNGNACWDWWGYTGSDYVLQSGVQIQAVKKIIDRLAGDINVADDTVVLDDGDDAPQDDVPIVITDDDFAEGSLKSYNITAGSVSVSGVSAGGFMAVQLHVAYSSIINGVGVFAAGPYYCALGSLTVATEECMYDLMGGPKVDSLISYTNNQAKSKTIDATTNLAGDKVYIFSGSKDTVVAPGVVRTVEEYYAAFNTATPVTKYNLAAQHCIPSYDYGETCGIKASPYIGNCQYEGAGTALQTFYGTMSKGKAVTANLLKFDQTEFFTGTSTSLEKFGYVYVPTACAAKTTSCRLHVSFHGCSQDYGSIQDTWAVHAGYNDWAEANNIIVVYPYVASSAQLGNPNACWDWWGYAGANYALQSGVQMQFSKKLIDRVMGV